MRWAVTGPVGSNPTVSATCLAAYRLQGFFVARQVMRSEVDRSQVCKHIFVCVAMERDLLYTVFQEVDMMSLGAFNRACAAQGFAPHMV